MTDYNAGAWLVDRHVEGGRGDAIAIRCQGRSTTYAALQRALWRAQDLLTGLGVGAGERVAMVLRDDEDFPAIFLGALRSGVIPVPLSTMLLHIFISNTLEAQTPGSSGEVVPGYEAELRDAEGRRIAGGSPPPTRRASSSSAAPRRRPATGSDPRRPPPPSVRTAGCAPATSTRARPTVAGPSSGATAT